MSWKTTCIEVPKNATDGIDDMDETFEGEFKDYSKKWGPSKGVHACMGSGARSSEDKDGNSNVEDDTTRSKLTYRERFILKFWNNMKNKSTMVRDMEIEGNWNCKNHERAIVIDKKSEEDIFENRAINDLDDQVANDL